LSAAKPVADTKFGAPSVRAELNRLLLLAACSNFAISETLSVALVPAQESGDLRVGANAGKLEFLPSCFPVAPLKKEVVGHEEHDSHKSKTHDFSHGLPLCRK
jgi:hypothetical protein